MRTYYKMSSRLSNKNTTLSVVVSPVHEDDYLVNDSENELTSGKYRLKMGRMV